MFFFCLTFSLVSALLIFLSFTLAGMEMSASSEVGYWFYSFRELSGGKGKDMHSFQLCLWRLAFVSTLGQVREKKKEFKAKHLRAFKMVLLSCILTWLTCNNTCRADRAHPAWNWPDHFQVLFISLIVSRYSWWYPHIYFHKENSVMHPAQTVKYGNHCYQDAECFPNVSGCIFQIWLKNLPF